MEMKNWVNEVNNKLDSAEERIREIEEQSV